jgi:hypothetical protein
MLAVAIRISAADLVSVSTVAAADVVAMTAGGEEGGGGRRRGESPTFGLGGLSIPSGVEHETAAAAASSSVVAASSGLIDKV